jgi:hypothetical protein
MSAASYLFVHSDVDDAGLDASEFRVVCHLYRRQNTQREGYAWPGKKSIARTCRLNEKTVERVLKSLVARNVISEDRSQTGQGAGVLRKVNPPDCWLKSPHTETDPGAQNGVGVKEAPDPGVNGAPRGGPKEAPQRVSIEGYPFEGNPENERKNEPILANGSSSFTELEAIGIGIPKALRAEPAFTELWDSHCQDVLEAKPRSKALSYLKRQAGLCRATFERDGIEKVIEILDGAAKGGSTYLLDEDYVADQ